MIDLAIISGTGFYDFPGLKEEEDLKIETRYGDASVKKGVVEGKNIAFIARHGKGHSILPNMINYRANLTALKELRTKAIIGTTVCGVLEPAIPLAKLAVFDDLYFPDNRFPDGGACTVYEERGEKSRGHYIFDKPFSEELRQQLIAAAEDPLISAVYAHASGPRFNTKPEIKMLGNYASFVSQTAGPEIVLSGELEIPYALLGFGVDYANGVKKEPTTVEELRENLKKSKMAFTNVIRELIKKYSPPKFEGFIYRFE
jgi:5'-methylthioadenosine phosphorylase